MDKATHSAPVFDSATSGSQSMAARIDAKIKQLGALGLIEAEIFPVMATHMADFEHLMINSFQTAHERSHAGAELSNGL